MPTPARTSREEIVAAGQQILEAEGLAGLTMQRVAALVGVRAPSLYKRVRSRDDLVRLIAEDVTDQLTAILDAAATSGDPRRDLAALAHAFRTFAHEQPAAYSLIFARTTDAAQPDPQRLARAAEAVLRTTAALAGPAHALEAARTMVAWAHGFMSMELAGAFRLGGDVDRAYAFGVDRLGLALEAAGPLGQRPDRVR